VLSFCDFTAGSLNVLTKLSPSSRSVQLLRVAGGRGRIRTSVARKEPQIYSLLALATHPPVPQKSSGHNCIVPRKQPEHDRTSVRGTSQCRKGSCRKTPALALLSRGIRPQPCQKSLPLKTQLAEGVEPPTL